MKSLSYPKIAAALLCDVQTLHSSAFTASALSKTLQKVEKRVAKEGLGFLTKSLPRLGKGLDKALAEVEPLDAAALGFTPMPDSKLPLFMGELFQTVLAKDGSVLPRADVISVKSLRQVLYAFYKLELAYDSETEQNVISKFKGTEDEIKHHSINFAHIANVISDCGPLAYEGIRPSWAGKTIHEARKTLSRVFQSFDPLNIHPRHGPGAVSTKEKLWDKYQWTSIPQRITEVYPLDAFFFASLGHVCDSIGEIQRIVDDKEIFARVVLVPKDSRGPRLISMEPLAFQWIQQGLSQAMVSHVERNHLTKWGVRFTDQKPNRWGALLGSQSGKYATLDLNEASDRVTVGLVRLLFPEPLLGCLEACRSLGTELPDGDRVIFHKFAPMGSALCFPVLALTVWSLLTSGLRALGAHVDSDDVYVYGDDVIVPTEMAENAICILETFGLKINRDKSCTKGFFRESCGMDAFRGEPVTPVRFRTPWTSRRCPDALVSWCEYANSLYQRKYFNCYDLIAGSLLSIYGNIPSKDCGLSAPSLEEVPGKCKCTNTRQNSDLQRKECLVWDVRPKSTKREIDGWRMLLRFFTEANSSYELHRRRLPSEPQRPLALPLTDPTTWGQLTKEAFRVREYTFRKRNSLRKCWRHSSIWTAKTNPSVERLWAKFDDSLIKDSL